MRGNQIIQIIHVLGHLVLLGAVACGEGTEATPDGRAPDASGARDAMVPDGGGGAQFVSNTPGATVVDVGTPATPNAVLLSSNLVQEPSGGQVFQQWFGEVKNVGSTVLCQASIDLAFRSSGGAELASFRSFASADPYVLGSLSLSIGCIAPGQIGTFYTNAFAAAAIPLASVTTIAVKFGLQEYPGVAPHPHAPSISTRVMPVFTSSFVVAGTLTGVSGPIYGIGYDAFPRSPSGLVIDNLFATKIDTLPPGGSFTFTTISTATSFTDYRQFVEFIDGAQPSVVGAASPSSALEGAAAEIEARRRQQRQDSRARAVLANQR